MSKFCSNCGNEIDENAEICPKCGVRVKQVPFHGEIKSSGIAVILSFFVIGLGQIYNGQIGKGILFIILGFILFLTFYILIGFLLFPIFWIYNMYDAYETAEKINLEQISK